MTKQLSLPTSSMTAMRFYKIEDTASIARIKKFHEEFFKTTQIQDIAIIEA